jgi:hypothetical protein
MSRSGHYVCCNSNGISGREWSCHIWNGMIMAYLEGRGHGINEVVCSNAKSENFIGETEENHRESGYPVFMRRPQSGRSRISHSDVSVRRDVVSGIRTKCSIAKTSLLSRGEVGKMWVVWD